MSNGTNTPYGLLAVQSNIGNGGTQKLTAYTIDPTVYAQVNNAPISQSGATFSLFSGDPVVWQPAQVAVVGAPNTSIANPSVGTIMPAYTAVQNAAATRNNILVTDATTTAYGISGILGIFVSCTYQSAQTNLVLQQVPYWPAASAVAAGTQVIAYVNDDPELIFQVQVSTSTANNEALASSIYQTSWNGLNANLGIGGVPFTAPAPLPVQNRSTGNTMNGLSTYYLDGSTAIIPAINALVGNALNDVRIIGLAGQPQGSGSIINGVPQPIIVGTTAFVNVLCRFNNHVYSQGTVSVFARA